MPCRTDNVKRTHSNGKRPADDGSILLIVLWWLLILSIMALGLYATINPRLTLTARLRDQTLMHYSASALLRLAMATVDEDTTPGYDGLNDTWSSNPGRFENLRIGDALFALGYAIDHDNAGSTMMYGLADEERRINVNRASLEMLQRTLEQLAGLSSLESGPLAAAIVDWRDTDDSQEKYGAEDPFYHSLDTPYECKDAPFQSIEELALVKGMTRDVLTRLRDYITIFGNGNININTAPAPVLVCAGLSPRIAQQIVGYRSGPDRQPGTADDLPFENVSAIVDTLTSAAGLSRAEERALREVVNSGILTVRSDNFRGEVYKELDKQAMGVHITFVFNRNGVIRFWQEF
jgi:general secretion pathway protein K